MIRSIARTLLLRYLPKSVVSYYNLKNGGENIYFSQEGEDIVLERFFEGKADGFYVDIGSHHPVRFSNTHKFYLKGWHGINIDATPGSMEPFKKIRKRDINVEVGISETAGEMTYYLFHEPALNTFSKERADTLLATTNYQLKSTVQVTTKTLQQILKEYLPIDQKAIDFLSLDVEGLDYAILASNDWNRYRPKAILAEDLITSLENLSESPIYNLLRSKNYELFARTGNTLIFRDLLKK